MSALSTSETSSPPRTVTPPHSDTDSPASTGNDLDLHSRATFYISPSIAFNIASPQQSAPAVGFSTNNHPIAIISKPSLFSNAQQDLIYRTKFAYDAILSKYMNEWGITDGQYNGDYDDPREFSRAERLAFKNHTDGTLSPVITEVMYGGIERRVKLMDHEIKSVLAFQDFDVEVVDAETKEGLLHGESIRGRGRER